MIILSVCRSLCTEYLLVTKPRSFNFINSHALLNTHECLQPFLCVNNRRAVELHMDEISSTLNHLSLYCVFAFIFVLLGKTSVDKPLLEYMNKKLNTR